MTSGGGAWDNAKKYYDLIKDRITHERDIWSEADEHYY